ncbi:MAG: bifunctional methylenetetrahydrofolate dehydrogenase/methenyltetrahydrofolate cyclohydrolase FolD [Spirochaetota bacterium]
MADIIEGRAIAAELRASLKDEVEMLHRQTGKRPGLAVVLVGDDSASEVYVRMKRKACNETGIESIDHNYGKDYGHDNLIRLVKELNSDPSVNGILVQLPLPDGYDEKEVINTISPEKDIDGFHPINVGRMVTGDPDCFLPCTPAGCQEMIRRVVPDLKGKHVVIVGRSNIVGKPLANMMLQKNETANCVVTVCHSAAPDISVFTKQADILVAAAGVPGLITGEMVKEGAVVIDVGTNRVKDPADNSVKPKLVGDVDFESVSRVAYAITPVPGGVGPMTITMLLKNTVKAFRLQNNLSGK